MIDERRELHEKIRSSGFYEGLLPGKDFERTASVNKELERYRIQPPEPTAAGFKAFFPESKVYSFEFPVGDAKLTTIITSSMWKEKISTSFSVSHGDTAKC